MSATASKVHSEAGGAQRCRNSASDLTGPPDPAAVRNGLRITYL